MANIRKEPCRLWMIVSFAVMSFIIGCVDWICQSSLLGCVILLGCVTLFVYFLFVFSLLFSTINFGLVVMEF